MLFIAPGIQVIFSLKRINSKTNCSLAAIAGLSFLLGLIFSLAGVIVSMWLLPSDIKCATSCIGFAPLGFWVLCITTPLIFFLSLYRHNSKQKATPVTK